MSMYKFFLVEVSQSNAIWAWGTYG